jgi:hypothetical protein
MEREVLKGSIRIPSFRGCRITVTVLITWTTGLLTSWWLLAWWRNSPLFMEDKKFCTVFCCSCHQTLSSTSCSQSCHTACASRIDCYSIIMCLRNFLFPSIFRLVSEIFSFLQFFDLSPKFSLQFFDLSPKFSLSFNFSTCLRNFLFPSIFRLVSEIFSFLQFFDWSGISVLPVLAACPASVRISCRNLIVAQSVFRLD